VLWLFQENADAATNLRREAEARGISSGRLIFAERTGLEHHLARLKLADLVLDVEEVRRVDVRVPVAHPKHPLDLKTSANSGPPGNDRSDSELG